MLEARPSDRALFERAVSMDGRRSGYLGKVEIADEHLIERLVSEGDGLIRREPWVTARGAELFQQFGILRSVVPRAGADQLRARRYEFWLGQAVKRLPMKFVMRHGQEDFPRVVRIEGFVTKPRSAQVHVRSHLVKHRISGECEAA